MSTNLLAFEICLAGKANSFKTLQKTSWNLNLRLYKNICLNDWDEVSVSFDHQGAIKLLCQKKDQKQGMEEIQD